MKNENEMNWASAFARAIGYLSLAIIISSCFFSGVMDEAKQTNYHDVKIAELYATQCPCALDRFAKPTCRVDEDEFHEEELIEEEQEKVGI
jgi:GTP cyclohydrolase FolE2